MQITIKNNIPLSNRYIRFTKWKLYKLKAKFPHLIYAEVFMNAEGQSPKTFQITARLGIPGNDIIIRQQSTKLGVVFKRCLDAAHRGLAKRRQSTK